MKPPALGVVIAMGASLVVVAGCLARSSRGVALYDTSTTTPPEGAVARLVGPIVAVDEAEVDSSATFFELLPGCHVVEIGGVVDHMDPRLGGEIGTLPQLFYAVWMSAGNTYVVELEREPSAGWGPTSYSSIFFREKDRTGRVLATLASTSDAREVRDCRAQRRMSAKIW